MKYEFSKAFTRQFESINNKKLASNLVILVESVIAAKTISDIPHIRKLKGHKTAFRIRSGDYRIGVFIEENTVYFSALAHRKDIYKKFP